MTLESIVHLIINQIFSCIVSFDYHENSIQMDSKVKLQTNCDLQDTSKNTSNAIPSSAKGTNGEASVTSCSDDSDIEPDLVSTINHNAEFSLAALKDAAYNEDDGNVSFFQRYFSNHSNSLPSRLAVMNSRRLSQCREEDEDEEKKDIVPSNMSTISGSDMSLSESSSGSKTSVIDTVSGPTHKFVIVKTKTSEVKETNEEQAPGQEPTPPKKLSEAAKIFASRKQYRQANTVHGIPGYEPIRPPVSTLFRSPLQSPHYDSKFFDSSLIEMKSQTSSSSTVDISSTSIEDIWVKRVEADEKKVSNLIMIKCYRLFLYLIKYCNYFLVLLYGILFFYTLIIYC